MKRLFPFVWVTGFTALALLSIRDARLCHWLTVLPAAWGVGMALGTRTGRTRRYFATVAILTGGYALLVGAMWWLAAVTPDWDYLREVGPFLLAGMLAPAVSLEAGPISAEKWKWAWLGLFFVTGMVIEANNLRLIDYHRLQTQFIHPTWEIWTEKYYTYWLLLLVWAVVAFFSWRRKVDRLVILGLVGLTAMLIWCSGRSARSLGILASGVAVYSLLNTVALSPRQLKIGLALLVLWWGAAPWLFEAFDLSQVDPRVGERTRIYRATHDLILQRPWTGHGFGQSAALKHPLLPKRFLQHLPGGHPHNLALLFWLEYGLAGALFLCAATWYLLRRVIDCAAGRGAWPALAALIVSFVAMVSFSWDIWEYSIILFYAAFAALVVLILNLDDGPAADGRKLAAAGVGAPASREPDEP